MKTQPMKAQRYLIDLNVTGPFDEYALAASMERALRKHVSKLLGWYLDVTVKVTLDQPHDQP